jgi:hypothetical protein
MADPQRQSAAPGGGVLLTTAVVGALVGAGGLAWWLWRHSRQRVRYRRDPLLADDRPFGAAAPKANLTEGSAARDALPDRVQQLNQAIEDVRRQLESLQSPP